ANVLSILMEVAVHPAETYSMHTQYTYTVWQDPVYSQWLQTQSMVHTACTRAPYTRHNQHNYYSMAHQNSLHSTFILHSLATTFLTNHQVSCCGNFFISVQPPPSFLMSPGCSEHNIRMPLDL
ncbi:hypothetical protein NPIL_212431, partial [Nephila pilipes]